MLGNVLSDEGLAAMSFALKYEPGYAAWLPYLQAMNSFVLGLFPRKWYKQVKVNTEAFLIEH